VNGLEMNNLASYWMTPYLEMNTLASYWLTAYREWSGYEKDDAGAHQEAQ
jgi:hypothetical protein